MKKSEKLKQIAQQEDNDLVSMGIMKKSFREARLEKWDERGYTARLEALNYTVIPFDGAKVSIDTNKDYGIVDFYPKANRLLIRNTNKWRSYGFVWIQKFLLRDV